MSFVTGETMTTKLAGRLMNLAKISDIVVGSRHRQDLGNLADLAKSIQDLGMLHPILITHDNRLVAGARRLAAAKELGMDEVPVRILQGLEDALRLLRAERDENTVRKNFTPTEAVAIGKALEALERPKAKARQREHGQTAPGKKKKNTSANLPDANADKNTPGNLPEVNRDAGEIRDKVAEAVGMSPRTYDKAKAVVEAAEADPQAFGDLPERMDATGKVDGAHQEMKRRRKPLRGRSRPKAKKASAESIEVRLDLLAAQLQRLQKNEGDVKHWISERIRGMNPEAMQFYADKLRGIHAVVGSCIDFIAQNLEEARSRPAPRKKHGVRLGDWDTSGTW